MGVTYDYESIMQYGPYDFAIDPSQPTMSGIQGIVGEQSKILFFTKTVFSKFYLNNKHYSSFLRNCFKFKF
jgi:hypothetical protein